jgi:hypothetical protein
MWSPKIEPAAWAEGSNAGLASNLPGYFTGVSNPIHVIVLLLVLCVYVAQAYLAGRVAAWKGRGFGIYLVAGLIIGPLVLFIALVLPRSRRPA